METHRNQPNISGFFFTTIAFLSVATKVHTLFSNQGLPTMNPSSCPIQTFNHETTTWMPSKIGFARGKQRFPCPANVQTNSFLCVEGTMFRRFFRLLRRFFRSMLKVLLSVVNGSRTTHRGQFVADNLSQNKILILWNFPLLFQPHSFINPISSSATFSSLQLPVQHHCFHQSRFHFSNIRFITPVSISAIFFSLIPLSFQQHVFFTPALILAKHYFHHSAFHFSNVS